MKMKKDLVMGFILKNSLLILISLISLNAWATPKAVMIIRHAEKVETEETLSEIGFKRANALVTFFSHSQFSKSNGVPDFIFAASPKDENSSIRSIQTATPIANFLKIPINKNFTREEYTYLTNEILSNPIYNNKIVLIVWAHKRIKEIAENLGAHESSGLPKKWSDKNFDRLWLINFKNNSFESFKDIAQNVLPGDAEN